MIVDELVQLTRWVNQYVAANGPLYGNLANVLTHNSHQSSRMPIEPVLTTLDEALRAMPLEQLSAEQIELLDRHGILSYLGEAGAELFDKVVKKAAYDPATAANEAQQAYQLLVSSIELFRQLSASLEAARVDQGESAFESSTDSVVTRVHFQDEASIDNVVDLEKWSKDWLAIAQGLTAVADERPEDIRIVGASTGSVILWLATGVMVATLLALLVKRGNSIILDVVSGLNAIEQLRHTRVMNTQVEDAMKASVRSIRENAKDDLTQHLVEHLGGKIAAENKALLTRTVEKYLEFSEKGGRVDMVAPPQPNNETGGQLGDEIRDLRSLIEDARKQQSSLPKQLLGPETTQ